MLLPGRVPASEAEHEAVNKLMGEHPDESVSVTRRDADESGPLLVHAGDKSWEISDDGKRKKVK